MASYVPTSVLEQFAALGLSEQELEGYKRRFKTFDLDKDGVISFREFAAVSRVFGYKMSKEEIMSLFDKSDLDHSGGITFEEFVVGMKKRAGSMAGQGQQFGQYKEAFKMYDVRDKGYITADEAIPILKYELGFDEHKTEKLVDMYDKNRDYRLSLPEFIPFYQRVLKLKSVLADAFNDFDTDKDGFISKEELTPILTKRGFTQGDVSRILQTYDRDGDGRLNFQEFAVFWNLPV